MQKLELRHNATGKLVTILDFDDAPEVLVDDDAEDISCDEYVNACLYALHLWRDGEIKPELLTDFSRVGLN